MEEKIVTEDEAVRRQIPTNAMRRNVVVAVDIVARKQKAFATHQIFLTVNSAMTAVMDAP